MDSCINIKGGWIMEMTIVELKRLKRSLNRKPKMPGINGAFNFSFLDKRAGKKDAQENQICEHGDGHITPHIDDKARMFDSYIDRMYLRTSLSLEPLVTEANALVVEFNLIYSKQVSVTSGNSENDLRQAAMDAAYALQNEKRKTEILTKIAEIKAESDMIDESLKHHIERAEGIFHSRISRYWKGVLSASTEKLEHFPCLEEKEYEGRKAYLTNREKLITMINEAIVKGGGTYEENE